MSRAMPEPSASLGGSATARGALAGGGAPHPGICVGVCLQALSYLLL